jgi:hypothetical protein
MSDELAPTLGPQVAHFIETFGVHGPGDLAGQPFKLSNEELGFLYTVYELKPDDFRPGEWRRRWGHGAFCRRKGLRKSELMALITHAEFDGPVRFSGQWAQGGEVSEWGYVFTKGEPIGQRVTSPEIPVVATTEEQTERLVWGVIRYILSHSPLAKRYKIQGNVIFFEGQTKEAGWLYTIAPTNADAADGAKPTFIPREEAHLWTTRELKDTAETLERNLIKRRIADPWMMDATTIYAPGEGSVLEEAFASAEAGARRILIDYRQASMDWDLSKEDQWLEAVKEASGDAYAWTNVEAMWDLWRNPRRSQAAFRRFQLNQGVALERKPFSGDKWDLFMDPSRTPDPGPTTPIVVFLDGAKTRDATAVVCWTVEERPHLWLAGLWERPDASLRQDWHVPEFEVKARIQELMDGYLVVLLAGDSDQFWNPQLSAWEEQYGSDRVVHFPTRMGKLMGTAIDRFEEEFSVGLSRVADGEDTQWTHDGNPDLRRHMANTVKGKRPQSPYPVLAKESEGVAAKIDAAVAAVAGFALLPAALARVESLRPVKSGIW